MKTHVKRFVNSPLTDSVNDSVNDSKPQARDMTVFPIDINNHSREFGKSLVSAANKSSDSRGGD